MFLPFAYLSHGTTSTDWTLMHDGARPHTALVTRSFLQEVGAVSMPWPAHSPDMNLIENIWEILTQNIYEKSHQFYSVQTLT